MSNVEIGTVELTENMVRTIAKQAAAERDRRAKIIHADAEFQASQILVNAAVILSASPAGMQLRYLQTLAEIGTEQNSAVIFPMPIDLIKPLLDLAKKQDKPTHANGEVTTAATRINPALPQQRRPARRGYNRPQPSHGVKGPSGPLRVRAAPGLVFTPRKSAPARRRGGRCRARR
ncbi:hypothetical protein [Oleispirillum naphthae]|uniref:hypothetical protein n=1 Tax=Oleispirillum naphthae TaxID=2838853 RepID=UPI003B67FC88